MWYLVTDNVVIGRVDDQKKIYGKVMNYIRQRTKTAPIEVDRFEHIAVPRGVFYRKEDGNYYVRICEIDEGYMYNSYEYHEFVIYISHFDDQEKSMLKPSYLDAVKGEKLLKPLLKK